MAETIGSTTIDNLSSQNLMAKALYDNKAETPDELEFRKGDILTVIERNVKGNEGWWRCSLHGRQGIAPGNRLQLLTGSQYDIPSLYLPPYSSQSRPSQQNIYQTPKQKHQNLTSTPSSGSKDNVYQVPSMSQSHSQIYQVPMSSAEFHGNMGLAHPNHASTLPRMGQAPLLNSMSGPYADAYDIPPSYAPGIQHRQMYGSPGPARKFSMFQTEAEKSLIQQLYDIPLSLERPRAAVSQQVYDVPPSVCRDGPNRESNYDIPVSYGGEPQRLSVGPYCTLPAPRKLSWDPADASRAAKAELYDVPLSRDGAAVPRKALYDVPPTTGGAGGWGPPDHGTLPARLQHPGTARQALYDVPPAAAAAAQRSLYDVPPARERADPNRRLSKFPEVYDVPVSAARLGPDPAHHNVYDLPRLSPGGAGGARSPAEPVYDVPPQVSRDGQASREEKEPGPQAQAQPQPQPGPAVPDTAREITLDVEMAVGRLVQLQQQVADSVGSIMVFVSSRWRQLSLLEENLGQIRSAAGQVMKSLGALMDFVRGVKVNATRLTDGNLQNRLYKQLLILEDSYQIMVETCQALGTSDWSLDVLVVSDPQANPDDLDRFIMVTRTVPDDVKRLASIIIANSKLLFNQVAGRKERRCQQPSPSTPGKPQSTSDNQPRPQRKTNGLSIKHKAPLPTPPRKEHNSKPSNLLIAKQTHIEDCDYVQLQRKEEFKRQEQKKESIKHQERETFKQKKLLLERKMTEEKIRKPRDGSIKELKETQSLTSGNDQCRMFFNALQKAIIVFTNNVNENQSSEVLIKNSKVVIMIGQKLVDLLCRETEQKNVHKEMLSRSNQFCGWMKKVAMATKNAVMQPNPTALQEMKDQVAELSQQAEQLRLLLEQATS
ncbi:cas scaffolding protein family member 4-like isoform X2 [Chiloscyllium punctatum]|uniref:cas scaffolding protein family member 4-like isoform X2 n=1 Tax=Chiloscyllium punctatum TaxID=137246 RepID=UPI003B63E193